METISLDHCERDYLKYFPGAESGEDIEVYEDISMDLVKSHLKNLSLRAGSDKRAKNIQAQRTFVLPKEIILLLSEFDKEMDDFCLQVIILKVERKQ